MKNKTKDAFKTRMVENRVQVWLGTPEESESELVLDIDLFWVPTLISVLSEDISFRNNSALGLDIFLLKKLFSNRSVLVFYVFTCSTSDIIFAVRSASA